MKVIKKVMSLAIATVLLSAYTGISGVAADGRRYVGDTNNDGIVDGVDASAILSAYAKMSVGKNVEINTKIYDFNHDGIVDGIDASQVLTAYAAMSTNKPVTLEVVYEEGILPYQAEETFSEKEIIEFSGISWDVHTTPDSKDNICSTLKDGTLCVVTRKLEDHWYGVYIDQSRKEFFIKVEENFMKSFKKIGYVVITNKPEMTTITTAKVTTTTTKATTTTAKPTTTTTKTTTTTAKPTTTTTKTTTTTAKPTTTTTKTTTTTAKPTTTTTKATTTTTKPTTTTTKATTTTTKATTTTSTTVTETTTTTTVVETEQPTTNLFKTMQSIRYTGLYCVTRSSMEIADDNIIGYLSNDDVFFIKKMYPGTDWCEIITENQKESKFIQIDNYGFEPLEHHTAVFLGEYWNVRSSRSMADSSNIIGKLSDNDVVAILHEYANGWMLIYSNVLPEKYGYVQRDALKLRYEG